MLSIMFSSRGALESDVRVAIATDARVRVPPSRGRGDCPAPRVPRTAPRSRCRGAGPGGSAQLRRLSGPAAGGGSAAPAEPPPPGRAAPAAGTPAERGAGPAEGGAGGRRRRLRERRAVRSGAGRERGPAGACSRAGRSGAAAPRGLQAWRLFRSRGRAAASPPWNSPERGRDGRDGARREPALTRERTGMTF